MMPLFVSILLAALTLLPSGFLPLLRSGHGRRRILVLIHLCQFGEILLGRMQVVEHGLLAVIHARAAVVVTETHRMTQLVADGVPPRRVAVVLAAGGKHEGIVH